MTRKRNVRKGFFISDEEAKDAKELRENIILGLVEVPKDHELYNLGVKTYRQRLADIKADIDSRPQADEAIKPAVPAETLKAMRQHAKDTKDIPFMNDYQRKMAKIRGEPVRPEDEFGFKKYPEPKPAGVEHALDNVFEGRHRASLEPDLEVLEFYAMSREAWLGLLPETRVILLSLMQEKERF